MAFSTTPPSRGHRRATITLPSSTRCSRPSNPHHRLRRRRRRRFHRLVVDVAAPHPPLHSGRPAPSPLRRRHPRQAWRRPSSTPRAERLAASGLTGSSSRVPFANITPAAEPRSALFASPVVNADAPAVNDDPDAAPEYRSVLLPKAEPEAAAPAANTQLPSPVQPDVDFSTVMLPRLSPAQLEAAGILPTVHLEPLAAVQPSSALAVDPVASLVDASAVIEQAEAVGAATVIADQVAIAQPSSVDATNEPAAPIATPVIRLKPLDEAPVPPVQAAVPVVENQVAVAGAMAEAPATPAAVPQAAAVVVVSPAPQEAPAPAPKLKQAAPAKPAAAAKPKSGALRGLATAAAVVLIVGAIGIPLSRLWLGRSQKIVPVAADPAKRPSPAPTAQEKAPPLQAVAAPAVVPVPAPAPATSAPAAAPTPVPAATPQPAAQLPAKPVNAEARHRSWRRSHRRSSAQRPRSRRCRRPKRSRRHPSRRRRPNRQSVRSTKPAPSIKCHRSPSASNRRCLPASRDSRSTESSSSACSCRRAADRRSRA